MFLCAALAMSACTQEAAVAPATTAFEAATTTIEPVPESTTTVPPDTTLPPETTIPETTSTGPETTLAPTTTVAATGNPTSVSTEYFVGGDTDAWLYLGRWTGNEWEPNREGSEFREPRAESGDALVIRELDIAPIDGEVDGSGEACAADGRTGPEISPNAGAPEVPGFGYRSIAFPADWSTEPRPVGLVDATIDSYVAAGEAAFDDFGIDTSDGTIQQLVVTDLDGDGDSEALVAFGADNFSALLLIDADSGTSLTISRSVATTVTPTTVAEDDEPGEPTTTPAETFRTLAVADLNGDGRFEIVAHAFEGSSAEVTVSTYDGTEVNPVLTAGC